MKIDPSEIPDPPFHDDEIDALTATVRAIRKLDPKKQERVLNYLRQRFGTQPQPVQQPKS